MGGIAERQRRLDEGRRRTVSERLDLAVTNALAAVAAAADKRPKQAEADEQQQSATHSFPTFPVYNRGILLGPSWPAEPRRVGRKAPHEPNRPGERRKPLTLLASTAQAQTLMESRTTG
jgi:hypothetical protein